MYTPKCFQDTSREEIAEMIQKEGFSPLVINDPANYVYRPHQHPETKLLVFLSGSMRVTVAGKSYECEPGDKLIIPGNTVHEAVVGPDGCTFFWSEKVM